MVRKSFLGSVPVALMVFIAAAISLVYVSDRSSEWLASSVSPYTQTASVSGAGSGLVAHYAFDEGSGVLATDSSGYGNNGAFMNGVAWIPGKVGSGAASFPNEGYIEIPHSNSLNPSEITISFWIKLSGSPSNSNSAIVDKGGRGNYSINFLSGTSFRIYTNGTSGASGSVGSNGTWNHIVYAAKSSGSVMYVNGAAVAGDANPFSGSTTEAPLYLGRRGATSNIPMSLDDVRIYGRSLSAAEISELYSGYDGGSSSEPPVVTPPSPATDVTAPVISSIASFSITPSSASISWLTNEISDTQVEYGLTTSYGSSIAINTSPVAFHSAALSNLSPTTLYHYRVKSKDPSGNLAVSDDQTFTTSSEIVSVPVQPSGSCSNISQYGITWTFDRAYSCGNFANGDWWVVGPVTITFIDPPSTITAGRTINGSMVNPAARPHAPHGFDSSMDSNSFLATLNAARPNGNALSASNPLILQTSSSLISAISNSIAGHRPQLTDAAVLTVLSAPAPSGAFRPPYQGNDKSLNWNVSNLDYSLLRNLAPVAGATSLTVLQSAMQRPWIEINTQYGGREMHPSNNQPAYGRDITGQVGRALLALQLNNTNAQKEPLLIRVVQYGLDIYGAARVGGVWSANGGHDQGRKMPMLLAAVTLRDPAILVYADAKKNLIFQEDQQTFYVSQATVDMTHSSRWSPDSRATLVPYEVSDIGLPEWGIEHSNEPENDNKSWNATYRDVVMPELLSHALTAQLMGLTDEWNWPAFFDYSDRHWSVDNAPVPSFTKNMWNAYRTSGGTPTVPTPPATPDTTPPTTPSNLAATAISSTQVNLSWGASTDSLGVVGYKIYRGTAQIATSTGVSYSNTGLTPSTAYAYSVAAYDAAGNVSTKSASASATTPSGVSADTTLPAVSITAPSGTVSGIAVSVTASASDNVGVVGVQFKLDGANLGSEDVSSPYATTWNTSGATNGSHTLTAIARDAAGNTKTSTAVTVTVSNSTPSFTIAVTKAGTGSGTVSSNVGGLSCGSACSVSLASGSSVTLSAVPSSGSAFLGWSGACTGTGTCIRSITSNTTVTATFGLAPDTSVPSTPAGLTSSSLTQTGLTLSWLAAVDNVGVSGYRIYRNGTLIASPTTNSYAVSGLSEGTIYSFKVLAYDAAGNESSQSNALTITTASIPVATYELTAAKSGTGQGTVTGSGLNCGSTCTTSVTNGTTVTLTASPFSGSTFSGWSGACTGTDACTVTVSSASSVTASFASVPQTTTGSGSSGTTTYIPPTATPFIPAVPQASAPQTGLVITKDLWVGITDPQVLTLQRHLVSQGYLTATPTGYFGPATEAAVKKYQVSKAINPTGTVGPVTRASLASGAAAVTQAPSTIPAAFTRALSLGSKGNDVKALQVFLNTHGFPLAATGAGSKGNETINFSVLTQRAVIRYQLAKGITPAVGYFGVKTMGAVNAGR